MAILRHSEPEGYLAGRSHGGGLLNLENLRRDAGGDRSLRRELAVAYEKIGDAQGNPDLANLGDSRGALASYQHAESLLTPLAWRGDGAANLALTSTTYKLSGKLFANSWNRALFFGRLGSLYAQIRQPEAARLWLGKSVALWRSMTVPGALEGERQKALAAVEHDLAEREPGAEVAKHRLLTRAAQ